MAKHSLIPTFGSLAISLTLSPVLNAETNPFAATDLEAGYMTAMDDGEMKCGVGQCGTGLAVDMVGNVVDLDDKFTYGGDNLARYADGKMATGKKDPAVCGTFASEKCSVGHLKK